MTFTRTNSGLSSIHHLHDVDLIIYIEGKVSDLTEAATPDNDLYDIKFYRTLFNIFSSKKVKINIAGSKRDALNYHDKIVAENIGNQFVIVDRDYVDILGNRINSRNIFFTKGYSWENDFWSKKLCVHLISLLTMNNASANDDLIKTLRKSVRRLSLLYKLNILMLKKGSFLFKISDKGGKLGINVDTSLPHCISKIEFERLVQKANGIVTKEEAIDYIKNNKFESFSIIQGHFLEYLVLKLTLTMSKKHSNAKSNIDFNALKNIAMTCFMTNPNLFMSSKVLRHYQRFISTL